VKKRTPVNTRKPAEILRAAPPVNAVGQQVDLQVNETLVLAGRASDRAVLKVEF
jgi:hypothetical protein